MSIGTFHLRRLRASARKNQGLVDNHLGPPGSDHCTRRHPRACDEGPIATSGMRQSPNVAFRGELEGKWEWTDEPLYMIAFIGSLPARRIRLKPSQWLQITPTIPPSQ